METPHETYREFEKDYRAISFIETDSSGLFDRIEKSDSIVKSFTISSGDKIIGATDLTFEPKDKLVHIEWFTINRDLQNQKYGSKAYAQLMNYITGMDGVEVVESITSELAMMVISGKTPVADDWVRTYILYSPYGVHEVDDSPESVNIALGCIEDGGSVSMRMVKR